ncbi:cupin domain-containing protein [Kitasatospora sp. NPDC059571]|uniref:cupin domain-containing protein n=1 Tax=Kitasatospora sp. NPDC059571 TaxID=3346871 RepID=UPI00369196DE
MTIRHDGGSAARPAADPGVAGQVLAVGTAEAGLALRSRGRTEVTVQEVTLAPGAATGWHYHRGPLIVVVRSGTLTRLLADGTRRTAAAGTAFVEPAGRRRVHLGRNLGAEPVELLVTYLLPAGSPLSRPAAGPGRPEGGAPDSDPLWR